MNILLKLLLSLATIFLHVYGQEEPHPYGQQVGIKQRVWNAINHPRLERNFCCCYCKPSAQSSNPKWFIREDLESYCGYEYCKLMFSDVCTDHTTIVYSGATGMHDPYNDGIQISDMYSPETQRQLQQRQQSPKPPTKVSSLTLGHVHARCGQVMKEGSAWWGEFQGMANMEQWS